MFSALQILGQHKKIPHYHQFRSRNTNQPIVCLKSGVLSNNILVVQFGPNFSVSVVNHLSLRVILQSQGIMLLFFHHYKPYTTLMGPNRLSLFFEGLFFFRLIPPAIVNQQIQTTALQCVWVSTHWCESQNIGSAQVSFSSDLFFQLHKYKRAST